MPIDDFSVHQNANFPRETIVLRNGPQVPASQTDLNVGAWRAPYAGTIVAVHVFARALAGTVSVDLEKSGTTQLSGAITPSAGAFVAGTLIATPTFAVGDRLEMDVTTAAASTADDISLTVVVKPLLESDAARAS